MSSFNKNFLAWTIILFLIPLNCYGKISIVIGGPAESKIKTAIPDFKNYSKNGESPELAGKLAKIISGDLDLSGYFLPMDKKSFLDEDGPEISQDNINFRNWSLIGTELLIKGSYTCIGRSLIVNVILYDPFSGEKKFDRRFLGKTDEQRPLMHRIGNEIIRKLTGSEGPFLSKFLFINNSDGNKEIYVCDFDGYNVKKLTSDKSIALFPRWSPEGDRYVYNSLKDGDWKLYLRDYPSGKPKMISGRKGMNTGARWADDGKSIDLTLSYSNGNRDQAQNHDIYSIDINGKILKRYTSHLESDLSPSRSPDGSKMVFVSNRSTSPQLFVKDLKAGYEERITFGLKEATNPVWSSLNRIAFQAINDEGRHNIYLINPDGTGMRQLTRDSMDNENPCWSPDGRYISFDSNRSGAYHLYIMNANGYNQRQITLFKGEDRFPSWSPF